MPRNVIIDNFTYNGTGNLAVFDYLPDAIFTPSYVDDKSVTVETVKYGYHITESITFKNTNPAKAPVTVFEGQNKDITKLKGIKVYFE